MLIDSIRDEFAKVESAIADGPIVPDVTPRRRFAPILARAMISSAAMDLEK